MNALFTFSEAGGHAVNEDAFVVRSHPVDSSLWICVLADGQGGYPGGRDASQAACQITVEKALSYSPKRLARPKTWSRILSGTDRAVRELPEAGFTTLVALCVTKEMVCGASSGDSAAIALNVSDQCHTLTENQLKNPPVGSGLAKFTSFRWPLIEPWRVLLMSDGVWKYVGWKNVISVLIKHEGDAMLEALKDSARSMGRGGFRDDFTLVAVQSSDNGHHIE